MCCTCDPWWLPHSLIAGMVPHTTMLSAPLDVKQRAQRLAEPFLRAQRRSQYLHNCWL